MQIKRSQLRPPEPKAEAKARVRLIPRNGKSLPAEPPPPAPAPRMVSPVVPTPTPPASGVSRRTQEPLRLAPLPPGKSAASPRDRLPGRSGANRPGRNNGRPSPVQSHGAPRKIALYVGLGFGALVILLVLVTSGGRSSPPEPAESPAAGAPEPAAPPVPVRYAELGGMTMGEWVAKQAAENAQIRERQQRYSQFTRRAAPEDKRPKSEE